MASATEITTTRTFRLPIVAASLVLLLMLLCISSLFIGSRAISFMETISAFFHMDRTNNAHLVIMELRLPRTFIAVLAGMALGIAGVVIQAMTRNPLAEPGIIGINAGAALCVLIAVSVFQVASITIYLWFGFFGAGLAALTVLLLRRSIGRYRSPLHLILSGIGVTIVLSSLTGLLLINSSPIILDQFRYWSAGSVDGRGYDVLWVLIPCTVLGLLASGPLARQLNMMALGDDIAQSLGLNPRFVWVLAFGIIVLQAGSATAAVGPISFVGLVAPHLARMLCGGDYRWLLPVSAVLAGILLLLADMIGRFIALPNEVPAGIVALLLGGPFFVFVVRHYHAGKQ